MTHSRTDDPEKAAVRIAEALTRRPVCVEQQLLAADIRLLAKDPAGLQHLEHVLTSYDDENLGITVPALIHRVMADLSCEADLILHRVRIWSICCMAVGYAGAAVILAAISLDPTWRLIGVAGIAAVLASIGLATTWLAARRRGHLLAEVAAVQALAAACQRGGQSFKS
ncbi:hypothetical protein SAMN04489859_11081 [Paracoccus alcaliphilus]|uniref:Uncharacterized protein n=1 Tax=Paracoccus alcaliphilus TaxID=34002 RepID=A0A1H8PNX6_9RHOB|nr:hypothetical protein [Paracoccus alcaliphilus]WCR17480.1 hypothetical protein JHW40_14245 [Paracoccus alcaliphilus]SEO43486.1 hypothetical protein SAMN04489859_11081 [Paracoccus alcaliphilus]